MKVSMLFTLAIVSTISLSAKALVVYDDGGTHDITTEDLRYSDVDVLKSASGDPTTLNLLTGGKTNFIHVDDSQVNIAGGEALNGIWATNNSYVTISSGTVIAEESWGILASDSYIVITGGIIIEESMMGLEMAGNSTVEIYGTDFMNNFVSVGYGEVSANSGFLTGTLQNGDPLAIQFWKSSTDSIILIPEPATLCLFALGAVLLKRKR